MYVRIILKSDKTRIQLIFLVMHEQIKWTYKLMEYKNIIKAIHLKKNV